MASTHKYAEFVNDLFKLTIIETRPAKIPLLSLGGGL